MVTEKEMHELAREAVVSITQADDAAAAEEVRLRYLGRKGGLLTEVTRGLKDLSPDEKRSAR
jgi:GTP1/Obg family GTP-binding protein